jgi:MoaA/NifB/PqqE/SkfB family radical SAM enzyme
MAADRVNFDRLKANRFLPDRVFVQISRRCNLTCSMCGWQIWKRNKGFMSVDLFKRVIAKMTGRFTVQASFSESIYVGLRFEDTSKKLQALYQTFDSE